MAEVALEVADIAAYLLSFASTMGIDVSAALAEKMRINAEKYPADQFKGKYK
jgi:NTP pyrophosphatase (non-canonical NTP hydrolase)